jgi:hypothetical protein
MAGFQEQQAQTMVETGLPGRPSTRARSTRGEHQRLSRRMAMRQKSMLKPCA